MYGWSPPLAGPAPRKPASSDAVITDLDRFTICAERPLIEAIQKMDRFGNSIIFVVDAQKLVGCISDGDIRRMFMRKALSHEVPIREVMVTEPISCQSGDNRDKIQAQMRVKRLRHMPVLEGERLVGILEEDDADARVIRGVEVEAAILCGGKGLRLGALTKKTPKPLLSVGGIPLLVSSIRKLARAGVERVNLLTHYLHEQFEDRVGDGSDLGLEVRFLREETPLGTAGGLAMLGSECADHVIVMNGDILTGLNFAALVEQHVAEQNDATVCVHPYQVDIPYGVVRYDGQANIEEIVEKPTQQHMIVAGVYVFRRELLGMIPKGEPFDIPQLLHKAQLEGCAVRAFTHHEFWVDIGHPEDFQRANIEFFKDNFEH